MTTVTSRKNSTRNDRNNPYILDRTAARFHRTAAGALWRWRTELASLLATASGADWLIHAIGRVLALVFVGGMAAIVATVPHSRRFITRRAWCVITRHRLQRLFFEIRHLHTLSGRLPLILWIRPTEVGERALIWCRAGICGEDFEAHIGELRAACYAREARTTRNARWSQIVTIDIVRRDTLAAHHHIRPELASSPAAPDGKTDKIPA